MGSAVLHKTSIAGIYEIAGPEGPSLPLVFDSPHSGTDYPEDFGYSCDFNILRKAEDTFVDDLFAEAPEVGAPLLKALFPRSYIDVNRRAEDIDPVLLEGGPDEGRSPAHMQPGPRSASGIGLIRRLVRPGIPVYNRSLSLAEIESRIGRCYHPYHTALESLLDTAWNRYGQVWHINCHSMPGQGAPFPLGIGVIGASAPDFVLGDRDGTTCDTHFTRSIRAFLEGLGYRVAVNDPYKGVELVRRYAAPAAGRHCLQIEISKALYMDEETCEKSRNYARLKADIGKLTAFCAEYAQERLLPLAAD